MNSLEEFYINSETVRKDQTNEESTTGSNKVCDVPIHSLLQSQPNSLQVNIVPLPTCQYDVPTYQNTAM